MATKLLPKHLIHRYAVDASVGREESLIELLTGAYRDVAIDTTDVSYNYEPEDEYATATVECDVAGDCDTQTLDQIVQGCVGEQGILELTESDLSSSSGMSGVGASGGPPPKTDTPKPARVIVARSEVRFPPVASFKGAVHRQARDGSPVRLDLHEDVDTRIAEGWVTHLVEAHAADGPAGFLSIAYIPQAHMQRYYPDTLSWAMQRKGGLNHLKSFIEEHPRKTWTKADCITVMNSSSHYRDAEFIARKVKEYNAMTDKQFQKRWKIFEKNIEEKYGEEYIKFKGFHTNRPVVDYINTYTDGSKPYINGTRSQDSHAERATDHQGNGIGTLMYETGALWMYQRGLRFYGSGIQSDDAQGAWASFERRGYISTVTTYGRTRRYLDIAKLLAARPDLQVVAEHMRMTIA